MSQFLYKIVTQSDWSLAQTKGVIPLSAIDRRDGFIHLSTEDQFIETANLYFSAVDQPLVIELDRALVVGEVRWEWSAQRRSDFPHLYAKALSLDAANAIVSLIAGDDGYMIHSRTLYDHSGDH